jgi:hypothetical protein
MEHIKSRPQDGNGNKQFNDICFCVSILYKTDTISHARN